MRGSLFGYLTVAHMWIASNMLLAESAQVHLGHWKFCFSCAWAQLGLPPGLGVNYWVLHRSKCDKGTLKLTGQASFPWLLCNYNWSPLFWSCIVWITQTVSIKAPGTGYTNVSSARCWSDALRTPAPWIILPICVHCVFKYIIPFVILKNLKS